MTNPSVSIPLSFLIIIKFGYIIQIFKKLMLLNLFIVLIVLSLMLYDNIFFGFTYICSFKFDYFIWAIVILQDGRI